jgi:hypothetical protein
MACSGATVTTTTDGGLQPCRDDQDCSRGYTCTGGYCQQSTLTDAGSDAPPAPKMLVSPMLLDCGNAYVGGDFTQTFSIGNIGGAALTVSALDLVEDVTAGAFKLLSKPMPFTVDVAGSETITVELRPNDTNLPTGSVVVHSDDPGWTLGSATVRLISRSKGSPDLGICAHNPTPPPDCQESSPGNAIIDYGTVQYGSSAERLVDLSNIGTGNLPIEITDISLPDPAHFALAIFELVEDPGNPEQKLERNVALPFLLSSGDPTATPPVPPTVIRIHLGFTAVGIDGDIPHQSLMIKDSSVTTPTSVPLLGRINGCIPVATDAGTSDGGADPLTDPNNCGTCGHKCAEPHATPGCVNGSCVVAGCETGYSDCNTDPADGCERNLGLDPDACGGCGQVCSNLNMLTRTCGGGVCNGTCATGFADCNGAKLTDGCEAELAIDPNNCGQCNIACSSNHMATRTCQANICNGSCASGYLDCDGNKQTNGCEINSQNDPVNCGTCGNKCNNPLPTNAASATCASGSCKVATCNGGYHDQNALFSDGCECQADSVGNTCGNATDLGTFAVDASTSLTDYNLTPSSPSDEDWFRVTFATNGTCSFNPKVTLAATFPSIYLRIFTNCSSGTVQCADAGNSGAANLRTWEYTHHTPCSENGGGIDPDGNSFGDYVGTFLGSTGGAPLPATLVFYIQVYATASSTSCLPYTLTISN